MGYILASGVFEPIAISLRKHGEKNSNKVQVITSEVTGMQNITLNVNLNITDSPSLAFNDLF